jgi:phosphatidylserine/phosphatidylglycerophosphate/cardiolipin synthase-like enzyme
VAPSNLPTRPARAGRLAVVLLLLLASGATAVAPVLGTAAGVGAASSPDTGTGTVGGTTSVAGTASTATGASTDTTASDGPDDGRTGGRILVVGPNPPTDGDRGEFVALTLPGSAGWTLSDGETVVRLPTRSGPVVVTPDPAAVERRLRAGGLDPVPRNATVVEAPLSLANGGERLTLRQGDDVVQRVEYGAAASAERYLPATDTWRPAGFVPREAVSTGPADATAFVLPDAPSVPLGTVETAERRILLAGYTFASPRVADALLAAAERNVTVRVLVEAAPVGGISSQQARLLDRLVAGGVEVSVVGASPARFAFHHPKYAVVDDRALVMTENWKPAGTGGKSSRGWGVRVAESDVATELATVFGHDVSGPDTRNWTEFRRGRRFERHSSANGSYPTEFSPETVHAENVTVLTAPGNAESALVARIDDADSRVDVVQPTLGTHDNALVRATLRAARRGVDVRILLSGGWYVAEENAALVTWLNDWADRNDAPLEAKIAEPRDRYEKIHAKGLLVDDEVAVVGSLNWNRNSARENREVALVLAGPEPVAYYRLVFEADWEGASRERPWVFAVGGGAAVLLASVVAYRQVSFARIDP